ncbi:hypothetical protein ETI06_00645 [Macrococcoides goetzii]|nr:hypothetical protein [Macrococcus goetzii]TDM50517.1 hypothetical protein ETI06_00645 [Macrococcus goetzii]
MTTFEILLYIVIFKLGIIILFNFSKKILYLSMKNKHIQMIQYLMVLLVLQSGNVDKDCNDSSFFDTGCDACGGDGGGD